MEQWAVARLGGCWNRTAEVVSSNLISSPRHFDKNNIQFAIRAGEKLQLSIDDAKAKNYSKIPTQPE